MGRFLLLFLAYTSVANAHNGKIAFAYPCDDKKIDANAKDWQNESWIDIAEHFGNPLEDSGDIAARYKVAYNLEKNALFFITEITDNLFTKDDYYEFYLNGIHAKKAGGVASFTFADDGLKLLIHELEKDPFHARITHDTVEYKMRKKGNLWVIEAKITLDGLLENYKTIGVDHVIVDVDESGGEKTFLNWGVGFNGFWKEYNSGQLGDVVLLPTKPNFGTISGKVDWESEEKQHQKSIRITHSSRPKFWVETGLDSLGNFKTQLPMGDYYISPSSEMTNPYAGDGYGNQFRVDGNYQQHFPLTNTNVKVESITIPIFKEPNYLFRPEGIIKNFSEPTETDLDAFIQTQMWYYNVPGAAVAVVKDGKVVYDKVFGVKSTLNNDPITKDTHFQAASVTKSVFAFIVNRLVDRGEFDLDTPLYTILPFDNYDEDLRYKKITGRMVLNHTTGMPNWAFGGPGGHTSGVKGELNFDPGSQFGYSGEAFEYLARVVVKLTGKDLNQLLRDEVVDALKIPELYFVGNENMELAQGHLQSNPTYWGGYATTPGVAHSMMTNASNFVHFLAALANKEGLSAEQYAAMFNKDVLSPNFPTSPDNNYWDLGVGLGFFVQSTVAGKAVMHGGSNYDFQSEFVLYPNSKDGFVVFANSNTGHKLGQALGKYLFYGGTKKSDPKP